MSCPTQTACNLHLMKKLRLGHWRLGNQTAELGQMSLLPVSDGIFWTVSSAKMSAKAVVNWPNKQTHDIMSRCFISIPINTYPYLFLPIRVYPDFFCCSFSVEHFWLETRQYRRKHSGNMPISLSCATGSSPLTPHGVASWSNWQQSSATLYTLF